MSDPPPLRLRFGAFRIDEGNARLHRDGQPVELPPKAFAVLCELARRPGQLLTKDALLDAVWGHRHVSESVLKTVVSQLRSALDDDARQPRCIETASRRGYRFIAPLDPQAGGPAAPPAEPLPALQPGLATAALVGRDAPLHELHACLAAARQGRRQLVLVAGEAGIGKSALIDRFVAAAPVQPLAQATGQCVEHYGAGEPYMPVLEALNLLCRGDAGTALLDLLRRVAPTWLAQLPWYLGDADRQQLQREVAGATQDRMLREFGELVDRCTAQRALLLVLEDLHWSDHATVQLIGYLARRRTPAAFMLLGSFRPTDVIVQEHPLAGLRQELRLHGLCRELDLESLSEAEVGRLVAARLGGLPAPEPFVRALHAHTEGLPLFVVNVLDELAAQGHLRADRPEGAFPDAAAGFSVPRSIAGLLEKQIARLPPEQRCVLDAASVAGVEFLHVALDGLLPMPLEQVRAALDAVAAGGRWLSATGAASLPDGRIAARYAFRHALYRHVFHERLGLAQRMQWHRQVAAALIGAHGPAAADLAAELAMHFERGGEPLQAARHLATAAGRALARSGTREALRAAEHGLRLLADTPLTTGDGPLRAATELELCVLQGVAMARLHVISAPEVAAAFERACALCGQAGGSPARARALHGLWWVNYVRGDLARARDLAQHMLDQAGGEPGLQLAGTSAMGITLAATGQFHPARQHLEAVLDLYARSGGTLPPGTFVQDPAVEARGYLALVLWWMGEAGAARRLAAEAIDLATAIRHPVSLLIALHLAAAMHYFAGELEHALALTERLHEVIRTHGLPADRGAFSWLHGHLVAALGNVDAGLAEIRAAEESCLRLGMRIGLSACKLHHAEACRDAGRVDEGLAAADQGLALAQAGLEHFVLAPLHRVKAELLHARGDRPGAEAHLQAALDIAQAQGARFHAAQARALLPER